MLQNKVRIGSLVRYKGELYSVARPSGSSACWLVGLDHFVSVRQLEVIEY